MAGDATVSAGEKAGAGDEVSDLLWSGKVPVLGDAVGRKWSAEVTTTQALAVFEGGTRRPLNGPNDTEHLRALAVELARRLAAVEVGVPAQVEAAYREGWRSGFNEGSAAGASGTEDIDWLASRARAGLSERATK